MIPAFLRPKSFLYFDLRLKDARNYPCAKCKELSLHFEQNISVVIYMFIVINYIAKAILLKHLTLK